MNKNIKIQQICFNQFLKAQNDHNASQNYYKTNSPQNTWKYYFIELYRRIIYHQKFSESSSNIALLNNES